MTALGERPRGGAFPAGEYVGQESFMRAGEVRTLAHRARVGRGVSVLAFCCGVAARGRMITAKSGCRYLGVGHSASALAIARELASNFPCRFEQAHIPPLPERRLEVVLLLETMLAFPDKDALPDEVARVLEAGGRFACTVEEGRPLTRAGASPDARRRIAAALLHCYRADSLQIAAQTGTRATVDLITSCRLWSDWLGTRRVHRFAMVAEKQ